MNARSTRGPGGKGGRRPPVRRGGGRGSSSKGGWCGPTLIAGVLVLGVSLLLVPLATRVWTAEIVPAANRLHFGDGLVVALALAGLLLYLFTSVLFVRRRRLPSGDYIDGNVYVIGAQMDPDFVPPSGSLNPAATVAPISPAGSAAGCAALSRPGTDAAGVLPASPGASTPAVSSFSAGCRYCICDKATCDADDTGQHCIDSRCAACLDGCPDDGCGWPATTTAAAVPRGAAADGPGAFYLSPSSASPGGRKSHRARRNPDTTTAGAA